MLYNVIFLSVLASLFTIEYTIHDTTQHVQVDASLQYMDKMELKFGHVIWFKSFYRINNTINPHIRETSENAKPLHNISYKQVCRRINITQYTTRDIIFCTLFSTYFLIDEKISTIL